MPEIFVSIGSNIEAESHIRAAINLLRTRFETLRISPVYRNPAVGFVGDDFLNLAVAFDSPDTVTNIRAALDDIESRCGRIRGSPRYAPRTLDLDLLMVDDLISESPVRLPRREILKYAYVLKPLADIAPDRCYPITGRSFAEHWREFDAVGQPLVVVPFKGL